MFIWDVKSEIVRLLISSVWNAFLCTYKKGRMDFCPWIIVIAILNYLFIYTWFKITGGKDEQDG